MQDTNLIKAPEPEKTVAIFIDGDNISQNFLLDIYNFASEYGKVALFNIYANRNASVAHETFSDQHPILKYVRIKCIGNNNPAKNTADFLLAMDVAETIVTDKFDYYCIASCDNDLFPVVERIRSKTKSKILIASRSSSGTRLLDFGHYMLLLDDDGFTNTHDKTVENILKLALRACKNKFNNYTMIPIQSMAEHLQKMNYNWKANGYKKLHKLIMATTDMKVEQVNRQWYIILE